MAYERESQLNDERRKAYATFAQLTSKGFNIDNLETVPEVQEAHAMVALLSEDSELLKAAESLLWHWRGAWISARRAYEEGERDPFDRLGHKQQAGLLPGLRAAFVAHAREELGVKQGKALELSRAPEGKNH